MSLASCQTAPPRDSEGPLLSGAVWVVNLTCATRRAIERRSGGAQRQEHPEGGAGARRALHFDAPVVRRDDAVCDREPEAGPTADVLGREERLEDASEALRRNARTVVADADARIGVVEARADPDVAAGGRGVAGVRQQVHEHLVHAAGIALDRRQRLVVAMDGHAVAPS